MDSLANIPSLALKQDIITNLGYDYTLLNQADINSCSNYYELCYFVEKIFNSNENTIKSHGLDPSLNFNIPNDNTVTFPRAYIGAEFLARLMYDSDINQIDGISLAFGLDNNRIFIYTNRCKINEIIVQNGVIKDVKFRNVILSNHVFRLRNAYTPSVRQLEYANIRKNWYKDFCENNPSFIMDNPPNSFRKSYFCGRSSLMKIIEEYRKTFAPLPPLSEMALRVRPYIQEYGANGKKYFKLAINAYKRGGNNSGKIYLTGPNIIPDIYVTNGRSCTLPCPKHCPE